MTLDPFVSVIVPVLDDTRELGGVLPLLADLPAVEVIVVRAGQTDPAMQALEGQFPGVTWTACQPGRARQMNHGAARARGRWLLFLHADARLDEGWLAALRPVDQKARAIGGSFRFTLRSNRPAARVVEWGVARRVRWFGLAYGDQALFVRRDAFEGLGGYRILPLMEDLDLVRRMKRAGTLAHLPVPVAVSARRWERDGWVRRTLENWVLTLLYLAGVGPERLARRYYGGAVAIPSTGASPIPAESALPATARVTVVIPALDEEEAIEAVLAHIPDIATSVIVVDNGSTDATAVRARRGGAIVVHEPRRGYGRACLAGLAAAGDPDVIVFLDADFSDYPEEMTRLLAPILANEADFVLGRRPRAGRPLHAQFGTSLCVALINTLWGTRYSDLGPFRAIRRSALDRLKLRDQTWGWTIEMQVKAAEARLRIREIEISQRERIGRSKISGTVMGTVRAACRMLGIIASLWRTRHQRRLALP